MTSKGIEDDIAGKAQTSILIITMYFPFSNSRYVIQVWEPMDSPLLEQLIKMHYRVVSVPKDIWYLDHGLWGVTKYSNWRRMYGHMLPRADVVLGGEVAMWTEYVDEEGIGKKFYFTLYIYYKKCK